MPNCSQSQLYLALYLAGISKDMTSHNTLFLLVGAPRFELGTPCTPCKCATRLRHAPTRLFFLMRTRHAWRGEGAAQKPNDTAILGEGCGFSAAGSSSDPRAQRAPASRSADSA